FGVPTVGGEIYFDECYHTNPLVNAMSVGIVKTGKTVSTIAWGKGNPVIFIGSATGKDGIGGASFASADITDDSAMDLPAVQVGDPFQEKKLLEACLEVIQTGAVVGMQDMGAAGIICSTSEMSAKGEVGMRIDLDKVPARQKNMKAWELLLSESQERMLLVAQKGREEEVIKVFTKWDLPCSVIGEVTDDGILNFYMNGVLEASLPAHELVLGGGAPQYEREYSEPKYFTAIKKFNPDTIHVPGDLKKVAEKIIQLPSIASKRWVYNQYDSMVGTNNATTNFPADAPVVLVKGTRKGIAMTTDCNSHYVFADPYKGTMIAVSEAARNIVCSGGQPLGVTNCLNFGNPYDPEVYYQFVHAIKGMGEACRKFDTPVTGGNVSFYNQNPDGPVYPTPTIGMVGLLEDINEKMTLDFKEEGDLIYLLGVSTNDFNSSQYLRKICGIEFSPAPYFELEDEYSLQRMVEKLIQEKLINSAHDVSEGGLFVTLCESGFNNELGFSVITNAVVRKDAFLFGEGQSRVVVSVALDKALQVESLLNNFPFEKIGVVSSGELVIDGDFWGTIDWWQEKYDTAIENYLSKEEAGSALSSI
ncbi:MAG TPA: phosphoribosylformylglycinamidine synthase subunit PurL, partial [Chitinophagaceae bacterium]